MTSLITELIQGNPLVNEILNTVNVYFIPIINQDGVYHVSNIHIENPTKKLSMIRKNSRPGKIFKNCKNIPKYSKYPEVELFGVDLNRNYDLHFDMDNIGSSNDPCDESFRGETPFSEPETYSMKEIVNDMIKVLNSDLKIAYNYHAWGNMIIIPPNFLKTDPMEYIKVNYPVQYKLYRTIIDNGKFPENYILGNGYKTVM